jgi:uncharacterized protein YjeT (DUF2065 family)
VSGLARDDGRHASAQDEDGAGLLVAVAVAAPIGALLLAGLLWLWQWATSSPDAALRLVGAGLLLVGTGLIFKALVEMESRR